MFSLWLILLLLTPRATASDTPDGDPTPASTEEPDVTPALEDASHEAPGPAKDVPSDPSGAEPPRASAPSAPVEPTDDDSEPEPPLGTDSEAPIDDEPGGDPPLAQPPPSQADAPAAPAPIATELERAKEAYFDGGHDNAIDILRALKTRVEAGEVVSPKTRGEIGIYLGELLLLLDDQEGAWQTFRWLLLEQPDYPILPALHPPEVVSWYEAARAEVRAEIAANLPPPPPVMVPAPYPWWGYAPFGAPQLAQGLRSRGALYAVGQGAAAGASIGMFAHLLVVNRRNHPDWLTDEDVGPYVRRWRNTIQWPSTAVFYALWVASVADGRGTWERAGHQIELLPAADGVELRLRGRF